MTNQEIMTVFCDWIDKTICQKFMLKVPDDEENGEEYHVQFAHPSVFPYFVPPEYTGVDVQRVPSICVQFLETEDQFEGVSVGKKTIPVRLVLTTWNPGDHVVFDPHEDPEQLGGVAYTVDNSEYERKVDGWKDVLNLIDAILREIFAEEIIEGIRADLKSVKYGLFKDEEDNLLFMYPYWAGYIDFKVTMGAPRLAPSKYDDIL